MMTSICKPPESLSFTGNISQNWKDFEEQMIWFIEGTESTEKSNMAKIGIMLSHAGKEAREVYKTLPWATNGDDKKFDKVIEAFRSYCSPRKHILYERYMFWNIKQEETEGVDSYLTRIKLKLDMCEYAEAVKQDMTRDKFVFGLCDDRVKERLLRKEKLNLTTAVGIAQRAESSKKQMRDMSANSEINSMQRSRRQPSQTTYCGNCGRQHKPRQCPAYGQECSLCHKPNHFARVCRSRPTNTSQHKLPPITRNSSMASRKVQEVEQSDTPAQSPSDKSQNLFY